MQPLFIELFSGSASLSRAMRRRGWESVAVDSDPLRHPDVVADVATWRWRGRRPQLVHAAPPCVDFSKWGHPWVKNPALPSMGLVLASLAQVERLRPDWWSLQNVRGSLQFIAPLLGRHRAYRSIKLWSNLPPFEVSLVGWKKGRLGGNDRHQRRAMYPPRFVEAYADAADAAVRLYERWAA